MVAEVATYWVDSETMVRFEVEPTDQWSDVSPDVAIGQLQAAVAPAVEGARAVLEKVKEMAPDEIEVKFGIKASGTMNWLVAKAASEGNFEITLTWKPSQQSP